MTEAVVRAQARAVAVGLVGEAQQFAAGQRAIGRESRREGVATLAFDRLAQGDVAGPQVAWRERRWLVGHLMRVERRCLHRLASMHRVHSARNQTPRTKKPRLGGAFEMIAGAGFTRPA